MLNTHFQNGLISGTLAAWRRIRGRFSVAFCRSHGLIAAGKDASSMQRPPAVKSGAAGCRAISACRGNLSLKRDGSREGANSSPAQGRQRIFRVDPDRSKTGYMVSDPCRSSVVIRNGIARLARESRFCKGRLMRWFIVTVVLLSTLGVAPMACSQGSGAGSGGKEKFVRKPHPANIEPLADRSLLLDIANTGTRLVAVGVRGHILLSKDGVKWKQVHSPSRANLTAVDFADSKHGWAVGWDTVILHTTDGGKTWHLQNFQPELQKPLLGVLALSRKHVLAVGAFGLIMETRDGGLDWKERT